MTSRHTYMCGRVQSYISNKVNIVRHLKWSNHLLAIWNNAVRANSKASSMMENECQSIQICKWSISKIATTYA